MSQFIKRVLYQLSREYSAKVTYYKPTYVFDVDTGTTTVSRQRIQINRAIVLPSILSRSALYNSEHGGNAFKFGAYFDTSKRSVIIRKLPFEPSLDDYLIIDKDRYDIEKVERLEFNSGWLIIANHTKGQVSKEIVIGKASDLIKFEGGVTHEL